MSVKLGKSANGHLVLCASIFNFGGGDASHDWKAGRALIEDLAPHRHEGGQAGDLGEPADGGHEENEGGQ